jgi:hypothetical protein
MLEPSPQTAEVRKLALLAREEAPALEAAALASDILDQARSKDRANIRRADLQIGREKPRLKTRRHLNRPRLRPEAQSRNPGVQSLEPEVQSLGTL